MMHGRNWRRGLSDEVGEGEQQIGPVAWRLGEKTALYATHSPRFLFLATANIPSR